MEKYIALNNQNFYDIVLGLYGDLSGSYDLLKNNEWLHPDYIFEGGEVVNYDPSKVIEPSIVSYYQNNRITPINGDRGVYFKNPKTKMVLDIKIENTIKYFTIEMSGYGVAEIDFGDNSPIKEVNLSKEIISIDHYMDNDTSEMRTVRLYLNGEIDNLSLISEGKCLISGLSDEMISKINVSGFSSLSNSYFCKIIKRVRSIDFRGVEVKNIVGLYDAMFLNNIDLQNCKLKSKMLDDYLIYVCKNYKTRVSATIKLYGNENPSGIYCKPNDMQNPLNGMEAVWVLVNDPDRQWVVDFGNSFVYDLDGSNSKVSEFDLSITPGDQHYTGGGNAFTK
ncbi:MAG: hypothetical protein ACRDD8_11725 [Bacteroidales bacterium]